MSDETAQPAAGEESARRGRRGGVTRWLFLIAAAALGLPGVGLIAGVFDDRSSKRGERPRVLDEVAVTPMNVPAAFSSNSPMMAAEPGEPRFVVMANRVDAPQFGCALQASGDGGRTWVTANPVPTLPEGAERCYAPEVAFDGDGRLYYLFVGLAGAGNRPMGAFIVTSDDRGRSFSKPHLVLGPLNFGIRMAIDRDRRKAGRIHLVWIKATSDPALGGFGPPPNPIFTAHSDDGGRTFSEPLQVSDPARERVVAPALALARDGTVHVAYYDLGRDAIDYQGLEGPVWEEPWALVLSSSRDGGRTFSAGRVVDGKIRPAERVMLIFTMPPAALVAGSGGLVCAAWTDARHGDADAMARCSPNGGASWNGLRRLNDDRVGNGVTQYLPRLSLSPHGRLDAVFLDRRDDPRNVRNHSYLTYSTNGGGSFDTSRLLSRDPSDSRIGQRYVHAAAQGQYEIGARLALLSFDSRAVAAWPDSRHWGRGTTGQDLFSATVALPDPGGEGGGRRVMGAAMMVSSLAALILAWRRPLTETASP